jgi:radical SAM-linked protein
LRYLSHAETMRVFQRACVRAGVRVAYSQGFNPHPRMSLVLPRSVGVESDDEMLCLWLEEGQTGFDAESLKGELPAGIEIVSVEVSQAKGVPGPSLATYLIRLRSGCADERVKGQIKELLARDKILIERRSGEDSRAKTVDIRPFLESIVVQGEGIVVDCKVSPAGTIRVDEILGLLQFGMEDLAGPVRRTAVQWGNLNGGRVS